VILPIKLMVGGQTTWTFVWFGRLKNDPGEGLVLCMRVGGAGYGGGGGCGPENVPAHQVAYTPRGYGEIRLGTAVEPVTSVIAQLPGGRKVPGVVGPAGRPQWD
jgi:hypothetical protein